MLSWIALALCSYIARPLQRQSSMTHMLILSVQRYCWLQRDPIITFPGRDHHFLMSPGSHLYQPFWVHRFMESYAFFCTILQRSTLVVSFGVCFWEYVVITCLTRFQRWHRTKYHSWWTVLSISSYFCVTAALRVVETWIDT